MKAHRFPTLYAILFGGALLHLPAQANILEGARLKQRADGIIGLMSFMLTPDVTTGSLALNDGSTDNPDISLSTLGGGFTMSKAFPLHIEGTLGYSRYDPTFLASGGEEERTIATKWNNISATGGIGWDFPITEELKFRQMFNFSLGEVKTDAAIASWYLEAQEITDGEYQFLNNNEYQVYGLGGSLVLDYENYREKNDIDVELRYTNITLENYSDEPDVVDGSSVAQSLNLWARLRVPTGMIAMNRPVRYVFEAAHTGYIGDMRGALGFDALNSLGIGLELDSSAYEIIATRWRLVFRYRFGDNVEGTSVGIAVSF